MGWITVCQGVKGKLKKGEQRDGVGIDGYLKANLDGIPSFLKKGYDCVGIISGMSKVRIGKSTLAIGTVGTYIAWILAGGRVKCHQETRDNKEVWITDSVRLPKKQINWNLKENVCFSAEDLQNTAFKLYNKYGKGQVIVYDEGRQGLDSARAMESINKGMEDFFQTCGFMGHVILIVLPSFFKLHEDYAVARSLFLINVYADKNYNRGYFSFYNEIQKEKLFYFGKKRIGVRAKYTATNHNFWGKFSSWFPFDKDEYEKLKEEAMKKARLKKSNVKYKKQRDACMYLLKKHAEMSSIDISRELSIISGSRISERMIRYAISGITKEKAQDIE